MDRVAVGDVGDLKEVDQLIGRLMAEDGQTLVEYGLLVALIALVAIAILTVLGKKVRDVFVSVNGHMISTS